MISLSKSIGAAGGFDVDNDKEINQILGNIKQFFSNLQRGRYYGDAQFPPQLALAKLSNEQLEEEGCLEEIEAQLINKNKYSTKWTKYAVYNFFIDKNNKPQY
ncbi:MAG: hypothetical protein EZS28_028274 [Streblomastix strix]|uniref:Uncharacterized protein n=1 Tax=Streblomastix strix TaxID=222440 RepID=A0A5J4V0G9_9EUKA|nr:MAG: hypothetical protein EZS28_028274 [Streblomastix strix]